jgi:hypothetical protein
MVAHLKDWRVVSLPLWWSWRVVEATPEQRQRVEIGPNGYGVHWPEIDEDISAEGMLADTPAPRPRRSSPSGSIG